MLVLSRHRNQEVIITVGDQEIVVTVVDFRADKVRLGFAADPSVIIHRREVAEQIARERRQADEGAA